MGAHYADMLQRIMSADMAVIPKQYDGLPAELANQHPWADAADRSDGTEPASRMPPLQLTIRLAVMMR